MTQTCMHLPVKACATDHSEDTHTKNADRRSKPSHAHMNVHLTSVAARKTSMHEFVAINDMTA